MRKIGVKYYLEILWETPASYTRARDFVLECALTFAK